MTRRFDPVARHGLVWFLLAQWACVLPLMNYLPVWLLVLAVVITTWRWQIHRGVWNYPARWIKNLIALTIPVGLVLTFGASFSMETMLSLLVAGFVLKLLELRRQADLILLCYLGYFVAATQLLFVETILGALYGLACLVMITITLLATHQSSDNYQRGRTLRLAAVLLLQAIPVMLVLFLVVPRFGSLWTVPLSSTSARTGVSDEMAPGDFSNLMRSGELAFRVAFDGDIPPSSQLYWRALVMTDFDGRRWRVNTRHSVHSAWARFNESTWLEQAEVQGEAITYQVMLEPTQKEWLYALASINEAKAGTTPLHISPAFTLHQRRPVTQRLQYDVSSTLTYSLQRRFLPEDERRIALALPANFNPETRRIAALWREQAADDQALIDRLLQHFREEFRYTLQPPLLGEHSVDEFLWQSKAGFCEHFSGSFVFFLRAAGIPARVVAGYQGGRINPVENYLTVRQYDAHAWAEVWLENRGWVRIDPTAAVAPERIEQGVEYSLDELDNLLLGNALGRRMPLFGQLQLQWDALNYRWNVWVMSYDAEAQQAFMSRWLQGMAPWKIALVAVSIGVGFLLLLLLWSLWHQRPPPLSVSDRAYRRYLKKLSIKGITPRQGESARHFAERAIVELPHCADEIKAISHWYERSNFAEDETAAEQLQQAVAAFKPR